LNNVKEIKSIKFKTNVRFCILNLKVHKNKFRYFIYH